MERLPLSGPSSEPSGQEEPEPCRERGDRTGQDGTDGTGREPRDRGEWGSPAGGSCGSLPSCLRRLGGGETLFLLLFLFVVVWRGKRAAFLGQGHGEGASAGAGAQPSLRCCGQGWGQLGQGVVPAEGWSGPNRPGDAAAAASRAPGAGAGSRDAAKGRAATQPRVLRAAAPPRGITPPQTRSELISWQP